MFLNVGTLNLNWSLTRPVIVPLPVSIGNSSNPLFLKLLSVANIPPWQWKQSPPERLLNESNPAFYSGVKLASFLNTLSYFELVETIVLKNCAMAFAAWVESGSNVKNAS